MLSGKQKFDENKEIRTLSIFVWGSVGGNHHCGRLKGQTKKNLFAETALSTFSSLHNGLCWFEYKPPFCATYFSAASAPAEMLHLIMHRSFGVNAFALPNINNDATVNIFIYIERVDGAFASPAHAHLAVRLRKCWRTLNPSSQHVHCCCSPEQ